MSRPDANDHGSDFFDRRALVDVLVRNDDDEDEDEEEESDPRDDDDDDEEEDGYSE